MHFTIYQSDSLLTKESLITNKSYTFRQVSTNIINTNILECANEAVVNEHNNFLTDKGYLFIYDSKVGSKYNYHLYHIFESPSTSVDNINYNITNANSYINIGDIENKSEILLYKDESNKYYFKPIFIGMESKRDDNGKIIKPIVKLYTYRIPFSHIKYNNVEYHIEPDGFYRLPIQLDRVYYFNNDNKVNITIEKSESAKTLSYIYIGAENNAYSMNSLEGNALHKTYTIVKNNDIVNDNANINYIYLYTDNSRASDVIIAEVW